MTSYILQCVVFNFTTKKIPICKNRETDIFVVKLEPTKDKIADLFVFASFCFSSKFVNCKQKLFLVSSSEQSQKQISWEFCNEKNGSCIYKNVKTPP